MSRRLYREGIDGLLDVSTQLLQETPEFKLADLPDAVSTDTTILVNPAMVNPDYIPNDSHLEFQNANGIYYWELFYHLPALVAQTLSENQQFEAAKIWYEYIFNPTKALEYWHFLPFILSDIDSIVEQIRPLVLIINPQTQALIDKLEPLSALFKGVSLTEQSKNTLTAALDSIAQVPAGAGDSVGHKLNQFIAALNLFINDDDNKNKTDELAMIAHIQQEVLPIIKKLPIRYQAMQTQEGQIRAYLEDPLDPHAIAGLRNMAYRRNIVMNYIDNILDWGDALFRQYSRESINEARMLYTLANDLLGKRPDNLADVVLSDALTYQEIGDQGADVDTQRNRYDVLFDVDNEAAQSSLTFAGSVHHSVTNPYFHLPENKQVLKLWDTVEDRLHKIRHCLNIFGVKQPLPLFQPPIDPMALVNAVAAGSGVASALADMSAPVPHYRFTFMLAKAKELAAQVGQFDGELLGTIEKLESEKLSVMQQHHEQLILDTSRATLEARLAESLTNKAGLEDNLARAEYQKGKYEEWLTHEPDVGGLSKPDDIDSTAGYLASEYKQASKFGEAADKLRPIFYLRMAAAAGEAIGELKIGSPFSMGAILPIGKVVAAVSNAIADKNQSDSEILSLEAEGLAIKSQHELAMRDWQMQKDISDYEQSELKLQIQGAQFNIESVENDLRVHDTEAKHSAEVADFLKHKFTNVELYAWLKGRLNKVHHQAYQLAFDYAKAAEVAFRFERGRKVSDVNLIGGMNHYWDQGKNGLQAGNQLSIDLGQMEKAYLDNQQRDHEITKTVSLAQWDPIALMALKSQRVCQFSLTEEMFAYDFPSHYSRQIKSIAVQIVAGDGTTVNAMLTQHSHKTIIEPDIKAVKYLISPTDKQPLSIRSNWRPNQQIAVSQLDPYTKQSTGVFQLNFGDERYLPFEGTGAVSNWQLEIPGAQSNFDINQLQDVKIEVNYTARNGGNEYANKVKALLKPYVKAVYLDVATLFANDFYNLVHKETDSLTLNMTKARLPGMHGNKIDAIYSYMLSEDDEQMTFTLNEDDGLILRNKGILLTNSVTVG
ncbi:MAG: hypothetical protein HRT35_27570, partial [Algicola sp.]|nr:hypothetical protein [Algicola sp.]